MTPFRQIRATHDDRTIRVYQAYSDDIAEAALAVGTFVRPFKRTRMTWIKPSFRWMLYRSGWARKDAGQARILAIDITRDGFEWALQNASVSDAAAHFGTDEARRLRDTCPVRVQWDPERGMQLEPLNHRSIQVGLGPEIVDRYVENWIVSITDVTDIAHRIGDAVADGDNQAAAMLLPPERPYPLPRDIADRIGST